eukprot:1457120-Pyramimonas_sp.AAC.1
MVIVIVAVVALVCRRHHHPHQQSPVRFAYPHEKVFTSANQSWLGERDSCSSRGVDDEHRRSRI